jgi:hypothetical protein
VVDTSILPQEAFYFNVRFYGFSSIEQPLFSFMGELMTQPLGLCKGRLFGAATVQTLDNESVVTDGAILFDGFPFVNGTEEGDGS